MEKRMIEPENHIKTNIKSRELKQFIYNYTTITSKLTENIKVIDTIDTLWVYQEKNQIITVIFKKKSFFIETYY